MHPDQRPHSGRRSRPLRTLLAVLVGGTGLSLAPLPQALASGAMVTEARPVQLSVPTGGAGTASSREVVAPFALIGVGLDRAPSRDLLVRVRTGGRWTEWLPLPIAEEEAPDPGSGEDGHPGVQTEPLWFGDADAYELRGPAEVTSAVVYLVRPGEPSHGVGSAAGAATAGPAIRPRSEWGARSPKATPVNAADLKMAVVHHSVTGNDYSAADVPGILRSIQAYHMDGRGWDDIAYNFAVDRFGRVWEARAGGTTRAVVGGHAYGFNTFNTGVVVLGDYTTTAPTDAAVDAVGELLAWKFAVHGVHPSGTVPYTTAGSPKYAAGTHSLPRIVGHRDVGSTGCPGERIFDRMAEIRSRVAARYPTYQLGRGGQGVVGDFTGDGRDDHLWYQPGSASERFRTGLAAGGFDLLPLQVSGTYRLVPGDFDGDGNHDVYLHGPGSYPDHVLYGGPDGFTRVGRPIGGSYRPFGGDFDGDGHGDVFWYGPGAGTDAVSYGTGRGTFVTKAVVVDTTFTPVVGDFDGDGRDDVFWYRAGSTQDEIWYGTATRGTFAKPATANISGTYVPVAGDRDGDGRDDLLLFGSGTKPDNLLVATSTRGVFDLTGFTADEVAEPTSGRFDTGPTDDLLWYVRSANPDPLWSYALGGAVSERPEWISGASYELFPGDFTGDGIDDLLLYRPGVSAYQWIFRPDGSRVQLKG